MSTRKLNARLRNLVKRIGEHGYEFILKGKLGAFKMLSKFGIPSGHVELDIFDVNGNRVGGFGPLSNVIVDKARENMSRIIVNNDTANRVINNIQFSDGGHTVGTGHPITPSTSDESLTNATVLTKTGLGGDIVLSFPSATSFRLTVTIATSEGNGAEFQQYSELGIFLVNGDMFSHKTFGVQTKDDSLQFVFRYTVLF